MTKAGLIQQTRVVLVTTSVRTDVALVHTCYTAYLFPLRDNSSLSLRGNCFIQQIIKEPVPGFFEILGSTDYPCALYPKNGYVSCHRQIVPGGSGPI